MSVETDLRRRKENRGGMSLSAAVECEWLDASTRAAAKRNLDAWQTRKLPLDAPEVVDWCRQVLGYFRNCWKGTGDEPWNVQNLRMGPRPEGATDADHAGVNLIRRYYPGYWPTPADWAGAYWGTKPEPAVTP